MKYYLRLNDEVAEVEGTKFKEDNRLFYVNLRKNNLSVNEANYLLVDIRTGLYVFSAKSKKTLFEIYQQQKEKYDNYFSQYEKLVIKYEKELKELIEKGKLDEDVNYDIDDIDEDLLIDCIRTANDKGRLNYVYKNATDASVPTS